MSDDDRRRFLKHSAALVSGLAASHCAPPPSQERSSASTRELDPTLLRVLAAHVLPVGVLGEEGLSRVVGAFEKWLSELVPVAELVHPYLWTDEIAYGPPNPAPRWRAQLEALELEAQKRFGIGFGELSVERQRSVLYRQLGTLEGALPYAAEAPHVAVGLAAFFYASREATDLAYDAKIERQTCRGLDTGPKEPEPLGS